MTWRSTISALLAMTFITACEPGTRETRPDGLDAPPGPQAEAPEDVIPPASHLATDGVAQGGMVATGRGSATTGATDAFSVDPAGDDETPAPPVPPAQEQP
jgi:hypothetical protein